MHRKQPEECEAYQDLCSKLCIEEEEEEEEEVDGDDDIRMTRGTINELCPLSGKPVSALCCSQHVLVAAALCIVGCMSMLWTCPCACKHAENCH